MKRSILRAFALCLTTAFVAGYAWAQDDNDKSKTPGAPGTSTYGSPGTSSSSVLSRTGQPVRLSKLMNTSLRSQTGDSLGQVQDIVVDPASAQIQFVVLSLSGSPAGAPSSSSSTATGIGTSPSTPPRTSATTIYGTTSGKLVAVPWRLLSQTSGDQFTVTADRSKLESAPTFSSSSWPTMDSAWSQRVYSHFGVDATGTGAPGSSSNTGSGTGTGTGIGNPTNPGVPSTPGTPDISPPAANPGATPGTVPGTTPGASGTGTGIGK